MARMFPADQTARHSAAQAQERIEQLTEHNRGVYFSGMLQVRRARHKCKVGWSRKPLTREV